MKSFSSLSELRSYLTKEINIGSKAIALQVQEALKFYVMKDVYNAYTPKEYERTYELLDSISFKVIGNNGGKIQIEVYFDPDKMSHTTILGDGSLGLEAGDNVYIPRWVDEGHTWRSGERYNSVDKATGFMKDTMEDLIKMDGGFEFFAMGLVKYLKSQGIEVTNL